MPVLTDSTTPYSTTGLLTGLKSNIKTCSGNSGAISYGTAL